MGRPSRSTEDRGAECDLDCGCLAREISAECVSLWPRDGSCDILVKNVVTFCPCPKILSEAKVKHFGLILMAEGISKQPRTDSVCGY